MKNKRAAALAVVAVVAVAALLALLPPARIELRRPEWVPRGAIVRGAFHIHTSRSDGTGTVEEVAAAAARAGLGFVVLTDHGDGTREPDPPRYVSNVLVIDGVEISTAAGHYAAVGLARAPYPLGGEAGDVVEDVGRLGGFGVVTHPESPKQGLAWKDWQARTDAIEWLNADSQWRGAGWRTLARAVATYPFRRPETLAGLLRHDTELRRWDAAIAGRRVVALAGLDAHSRIGTTSETEPREGRTILRLPSYEASFRTFSLHVVMTEPPSSDAATDAARLVEALRAGRVHTVVDAWASPAVFEFSARADGRDVPEGAEVETSEPLVLRIHTNAPLYSRVVLRRNGSEVHGVDRHLLVYATDQPGTYRAEVWVGTGRRSRGVPWILSNPIYVRSPAAPQAAQAVPSSENTAGTPYGAGPMVDLASGPFRIEQDNSSSAELIREKGRDRVVSLRYRLGGGAKAGQYVALAADTRMTGDEAAVEFAGVADRPMRVSVQVRAPGGREGERWRKSVYLDVEERVIHVPLSEMVAAGRASTPRPRAAEVEAVLLVVDTVNTAPGSRGKFSISGLKVLGRARP